MKTKNLFNLLSSQEQQKLLSLLKDKNFIAILIRKTLTLGEIIKIDKESAELYVKENSQHSF